jgi:hypothetical protein
VAGEHLPPLTPRGWEAVLRERVAPRASDVPFRLVRSSGARAVVEVGHRTLAAARAAWNSSRPDGVRLTTVRTWGTLVDAKRWLATSPRAH